MPALAAVLACYALTLGYSLTRPAIPGPDPPLAAWLRTRHLTYGLSATWLASNGITLDSHNQVQVRPIGVSASGLLANVRWNTKTSWYNPRYHNARFVIWDPVYLPSERAIFAAEGG